MKVGNHLVGAVIGFLLLGLLYIIIHMIDYAFIYAIFIYIQSLVAPFLIAVDYSIYVVRFSIPYIFMYILICMFFNIQSYKKNSTIKFLKYSIDINAVRKSKLYIYACQYNYILIIALNLFLLFIVYYAYINHKYFYLLFVFLFYLFIWVVIKVKHLLLKNEKLQSKQVHMFINVILVVLVGTYISMALDEFNVSNEKLYGLENFWKLIDNKFFIKMPSKDFNWNRVFNWSKQASTDRYMIAMKNSLMKNAFLDKNQENNVLQDTQKIENINLNDDINLNKNVNIAKYLHKMQNEDYNMSKFTNAIYQKFKKVFLIQAQIKKTNFLPTSEINARQKLVPWLKNSSNIIDLSKFYMSTESENNDFTASLYEDYLDLVDKKFNDLTSKKVFLIKLHKNFLNFKTYNFYVEYMDSLKQNYANFLNSEKYNIDLKNNSILNFEYNSDLLLNFEFNNLWHNLENELYIIFKEQKIALSLFTKKVKALYKFKSFNFAFKEDVLTDSDRDLIAEIKPKAKTKIPDFKKLQAWKAFKLNYKEILYNYTKELRGHKNYYLEDKWIFENKLTIVEHDKKPFNEILFWVEDDVAYLLTDHIKLTQVDVDNLIFNTEFKEYDEFLSNYVSYYLENIKSNSRAFDLHLAKKFTKILINDLENKIAEFQNQKIHVPKYQNIYHEIMYQNSNEFFKFILENFEISRDLLTSSRSFMTFEMWNALMHKLLNLKLNSIYLKNLTDFNDFCKSDFTDDLQFNFSLAFDIIQNKYEYVNLQMIPDLEGLPGTFYEHAVKAIQQMERYYWYEEQEAHIDWFYEVAYYSLVHIMDTVKTVNHKENDFLYEMANMYKREAKYLWIAESHEYRELIKPSQQLLLLNKNLNILNDIEAAYNKKEFILFKDSKDFKMLEKMDLMNFDQINDMETLNFKLGRDINILSSLFKWQMNQALSGHLDMVDGLSEVHHTDVHTNEFDFMLYYYSKDREVYNCDLGVIGGVGLSLNHKVFEPLARLDDFMEFRNMQQLEYLLEEMESIMQNEFNNLLETEVFDNYIVEENSLLIKKNKFILLNYKTALQEAQFKILNKMIYKFDDKDFVFFDTKQEINKLDKLALDVWRLKMLELKQIQLEKLPIFDWTTQSFIDENINYLQKEHTDLLLKKLDLLDNELKMANEKRVEKIKVYKEYGKKLIKDSIKNPKNPLTKKYLQTDWDKSNYLSNKSNKAMRDWYKGGKKK